MGKAADKLKTASVLAFEKKLANSDGVLFSGNWADRDDDKSWLPLPVTEKAVRGTISNRQKAAITSDPAKLNAEVQKANLQRVDVSALPQSADTLKLTFSLRILGNLDQPTVCNDPAYQSALGEVIKSYTQQTNFAELSRRYAYNIANGRFLWRNRVGCDEVEVRVRQIESGEEKNKWEFDGQSLSLRDFATENPDIDELGKTIAEGLLGESFVLLQVDAFVRIGAGQEVFPSQELVLDNSNSKDNKKSKILYQVAGQAALHSQKIGNALRTIDSWYPGAETLGPISVEPFGSVTSRGRAYRSPKDKLDFYNLLDNWVLKGKEPDLEQQHYVMAILIRGGVFGEKSE